MARHREQGEALEDLLARVRACRHCAARLPLGPRPVLRARTGARLLIVGQAPGRRVHDTGLPWNDRSGDRLREWLAVDRRTFYDADRIAIMPMGFCYPGTDPRGGDRPPRPECAPLWHASVLRLLPAIELTLPVGSHAIRHYLARDSGATMTATVAAWRDCLPRALPLPHPSWRNHAWLRRHPWFRAELVPELRRRVNEVLAPGRRHAAVQASAASA